jgi:hypothetical protein
METQTDIKLWFAGKSWGGGKNEKSFVHCLNKERSTL